MGRVFYKGWYYAAFALIFFLFWFLFKMGGMPEVPRALLSTAIDVTVTISIMIVTVEILLPRLIYNNRFLLFFTCFFACIFLGGTLIILSQLHLQGTSLSDYPRNVARSQKHFFYWFWADLVFGSYFMIFFISATGAAVRLAFDRIKALNKVERLQKEKALSELETLRAQIHPHFLFNALNTIYYKIDRSNPQARATLQRFSNMLRYQLYDCNKPFIEVEKEFLFIQSYVELQQERMNNNYRITCMGFDEMKGFVISPFLLMPLVENCFKHVSDHREEENRISIDCGMEDNTFWLRTCNTVATDTGTGSTGIGLKNIRQRLQLIYPGKHELIIAANPGSFEARLKLEL
ncbi:MAG TPA: histidine kinase [Puia sp.]|nr:histidine kinase [Puia sp.]